METQTSGTIYDRPVNKSIPEEVEKYACVPTGGRHLYCCAYGMKGRYAQAIFDEHTTTRWYDTGRDLLCVIQVSHLK